MSSHGPSGTLADMAEFRELRDGVHLLVYPFLRVNCTLIVGDGEALLVDTLSTQAQAADLLEAARRITSAPLTLVNTHFHFDHSFGNATLADTGTAIWGHTECARELRDRGEHWQRHWQEEFAGFDEQIALEIGQVEVLPPNHEVQHDLTVNVGGRSVTMSHHGRGHTAGDLVVRVDDIIVAGDLVEEGAPPGFGDSYPLDWPETLGAVIGLAGPETVIIPGHGEILDLEYARAQHDELAKLEWLIREAHGDGADVEKVAQASTLSRWGEAGLVEARHAVRRGYAQLDVL